MVLTICTWVSRSRDMESEPGPKNIFFSLLYVKLSPVMADIRYPKFRKQQTRSRACEKRVTLSWFYSDHQDSMIVISQAELALQCWAPWYLLRMLQEQIAWLKRAGDWTDEALSTVPSTVETFQGLHSQNRGSVHMCYFPSKSTQLPHVNKIGTHEWYITHLFITVQLHLLVKVYRVVCLRHNTEFVKVDILPERVGLLPWAVITRAEWLHVTQ